MLAQTQRNAVALELAVIQEQHMLSRILLHPCSAGLISWL